MYNRLLEFIEKHDILYSSQFGFWEKHSTSLAITHLVNKLPPLLIAKKSQLVYFLTFAKAFDTIDHDILLAKLVHYGICVQALQWSVVIAVNNIYNIKKLSHLIIQLNVEFLPF
jgi:hypothetical protein